jgi:hypothetical protein
MQKDKLVLNIHKYRMNGTSFDIGLYEYTKNASMQTSQPIAN